MVPCGLTIAEIIEVIQPDEILRIHGAVFIGDFLIPRDRWHLVRPKEHALISIRLLPSGGGGWVRILAVIAVAALAIAATVVLGPAGFGLVGFAAASMIGAAVAIGGSILVNSLLPPPIPAVSKDYGKTNTAYAISGGNNRADFYGKLPFLLGRFRVVPPYAALPYREVLGGQIYWRALFAVAHGPIAREDFRIGTTSYTEFQGVEIETRRGYWSFTNKGNWSAAGGVFPSNPTFGDQWHITTAGSMGGQAYTVGQSITHNGAGVDSPAAWDIDEEKQIKLFADDVFEDALAAKVDYGSPVTRTSQQKADVIAIEIVFDRGLVHIQNNPPGKQAPLGAAIRVEQSPVGSGTWFTILETTITGQQTEPLFWGWRWPTIGYGAQDADKQYDVRVTRLNPNEDEQRNFGNYSWYSLKSETYNSPLPFPGVAYLAMRVKASGQLSGSLDQVSVICTTMARDWNKETGRWIWLPTSSPAALYRHVLQHPTREFPATDAQIDLEKLQYWDDITRPAGRNFNGIYDSKTSLWSVLVDIARVGRAVPTLRDLIFSVIIDEPKTTPVRMFTPRNSWGYTGELTHAIAPHAYRIGFVNADHDWNTEEVVAYDDGFDATNAKRIDKVEWIGIVDHSQAWKEGRVHIAQQRLRREVHRIQTDFEHLCCERGDLVALQYDTMSVGMGSSRITARTDNGTRVLTVTLDEKFTMANGLQYGIRARRIVGGAQRTDLYKLSPAVGTFSVFNLEDMPLIDDAPDVGDLVAFGQLGTESLRTIVRDIEPRNDLSAQLTLISEAAGIHVAETGVIPEPDPMITSPFPPPRVLSIVSDATVMMVTASRTLITRVVFTISASSVAGAKHDVVMRPTGTDGQWVDATIQEESPTVIKITGVESGKTYDFRITRSHPDYLTHPATQVNAYRVVGRSAPPAGLQNMNIAIVGGQALLRWDLPEDLDVQIGGWIIFRWSPAMTGATWSNSTSIGRSISGDQTFVYLPLKPGTYMARVYDADGRESATTASVTTKQASVLTFTPVDSIQEDPTFTGTKTGCEVVDSALQLLSGSFDSVADVDLLPDFDITGSTVVQNGTYEFANAFDFLSIINARITSHVTIVAINLFDMIDGDDMIDSPEDFDGTTGAPVDAVVYGKLTDDDPAGSPTWTPFMRIDSAEVECRAVGHLECRLSTADTAYNLQVTELRMVAEAI